MLKLKTNSGGVVKDSEKQYLTISRFSIGTIFKLNYLGVYIGFIIYGVLEITLDMFSINGFTNLSFNLFGLDIFSGVVGLILLPLTTGLAAAAWTLVFGSLNTLGLYLWSFAEDLNIAYIPPRYQK